MTTPAPLLPMQIRKAAEISPCGTFRWTLERRWAEGRPLLWIMLNPSTADAGIDDPTIRRVVRFTHNWGYPAALVMNLYPFRSPSPAALRAWYRDDGEKAVLVTDENRRRVAAQIPQSAGVVFAWGNLDTTDDLDWEWLDRVWRGTTLVAPLCLGVTGRGMPIHPMARGRNRVPDDARPVPFRLEVHA